MYRLHIIGSGPRTGTSLLQSLCAHGFDFELVSSGEEDVLWNPRLAPDRCVLSKDPNGIFLVRPYFKADPSLYILCLIRDPRDMVCSIHNESPGMYFVDITFWRHFVRFHERIRHNPRYYPVRYEDLVQDPDNYQERIMHKFPFLRKTNDFSGFHTKTPPLYRYLDEAMNGVRPVSSASVGSWRSHLPRIKGQLEQFGDFITPGLIQFGYEHDESWKDILADVEPDFSPSVISGDDVAKRMPYSRFLMIREYLRIYLRRLSLDPSPTRSATHAAT